VRSSSAVSPHSTPGPAALSLGGLGAHLTALPRSLPPTETQPGDSVRASLLAGERRFPHRRLSPLSSGSLAQLHATSNASAAGSVRAGSQNPNQHLHWIRGSTTYLHSQPSRNRSPSSCHQRSTTTHPPSLPFHAKPSFPPPSSSRGVTRTATDGSGGVRAAPQQPPEFRVRPAGCRCFRVCFTHLGCRCFRACFTHLGCRCFRVCFTHLGCRCFRARFTQLCHHGAAASTRAFSLRQGSSQPAGPQLLGHKPTWPRWHYGTAKPTGRLRRGSWLAGVSPRRAAAPAPCRNASLAKAFSQQQRDSPFAPPNCWRAMLLPPQHPDLEAAPHHPKPSPQHPKPSRGQGQSRMETGSSDHCQKVWLCPKEHHGATLTCTASSRRDLTEERVLKYTNWCQLPNLETLGWAPRKATRSHHKFRFDELLCWYGKCSTGAWGIQKHKLSEKQLLLTGGLSLLYKYISRTLQTSSSQMPLQWILKENYRRRNSILYLIFF